MSIAGSTTYSYKDLTGSITIGGVPFQFTGQKGVRQVRITMITEPTIMDTASDGAVMTTAVAGDSATWEIECQQTSSMYKFLLAQYNILKAARNAGDVSLWAAGAGLFRNVLDGSTHVGLGIALMTPPAKTYAAAGQYLVWRLAVADCQNL
jgi:hypothetical protein